MSEAAKKRRQKYRQQRRNRLAILFSIILLLGVLLGWSLLSFYRLSETSYISFSEKSAIDYRVRLEENDFYEDEWLGSNQAYVASLIDEVATDFFYQLKVADQPIDFSYSYSVSAKLEVIDNKSEKVIFDPVYSLKDPVSKKETGTSLTIKESVVVDYDTYEAKAQDFLITLGLEDTTTTLLVRMNVNIEGACDAIETPSKSDYVITLRIPLTQKTVDVHMTSTVPNGEGRLIACNKTEGLGLYKWLAIGSGAAEAIMIIILLCFSISTRNQDINYTLRIKRLLSGYRSFIQQMEDPFDTEGYRVVRIKTFTELLGIRDTIQSPVLMYENIDKTCTQFLVPAASQILYLFEIKVDDYDEIYSASEAQKVSVPSPKATAAKVKVKEKKKADPLSGAILASATLAAFAMAFGIKKK